MDKKEYIEQLASRSFVLKNGYLNIIEEGGPASSLFYNEGQCSYRDFHNWLSNILSDAYDQGAASKDIVSTPDEAALAKAREEGERKGWEDAIGNLGMAIAMDQGLIGNLRAEANRAIIAVKEAEAKVESGKEYYDFLKFRAPEGIKIGYADSDSSKKEGK
jgi:hypothetical protein